TSATRRPRATHRRRRTRRTRPTRGPRRGRWKCDGRSLACPQQKIRNGEPWNSVADQLRRFAERSLSGIDGGGVGGGVGGGGSGVGGVGGGSGVGGGGGGVGGGGGSGVGGVGGVGGVVGGSGVGGGGGGVVGGGGGGPYLGNGWRTVTSPRPSLGGFNSDTRSVLAGLDVDQRFTGARACGEDECRTRKPWGAPSEPQQPVTTLACSP